METRLFQVAAALILGVVIGYWAGDEPERRYTVGQYRLFGSGSHDPVWLYRYDAHTGKTWTVSLYSQHRTWRELSEPKKDDGGS